MGTEDSHSNSSIDRTRRLSNAAQERARAAAQDINRAINRAIERATQDNSAYCSPYYIKQHLKGTSPNSDSKSRGSEDPGVEVIEDPSAKLHKSFHSDSSVENAENAHDTSLSTAASEGVSEDVSLVTGSYHSDSEDSSKESDNQSIFKDGGNLTKGSDHSENTGNTESTTRHGSSSANLYALNKNSHRSPERDQSKPKQWVNLVSTEDKEERKSNKLNLVTLNSRNATASSASR